MAKLRMRIFPVICIFGFWCILGLKLISTTTALPYDVDKNQIVDVETPDPIEKLVEVTTDMVVSTVISKTTSDEETFIDDDVKVHETAATPNTSTSNTNTSAEKQRCWGLNTCSTTTPPVDDASASGSIGGSSNTSNNNNSDNINQTTSSQNIKKKTPFNATPFMHVDLSIKPKKLPPEGYRVTAVVYSDDDGLSYFWKGSEGQQQGQESLLPYIPFLECNAVGSTTAQLPFKYGTFRNFPCGAQPASFSPATYPGQLLICLSAVQLTVSGNEEETRTFHAGDVILLEDTTGKGHKVRACCTSDCTDTTSTDLASHVHDDMNVMLLTLPHPSGWQHKSSSGSSSSGSSSSGSNGHRRFAATKGGGWHLFQRHHAGEDGIPQPCKEELDPTYSAHGTTTTKKEPSEITSSTTASSPMALDLDASKRTVLNFLWTWRLLIVEALVLPLKPSLRLCDIIIALNKRWKSDRILDPNVIFSSCYWFTRGVSWALLALGEEVVNWIQKRKIEAIPSSVEEEDEEELILQEQQHMISKKTSSKMDIRAENNSALLEQNEQ